MKYKSHSFSTELAKSIGLKESIILSHLYFWFEKNRSNNKNFHDGTWWTFNSIKAFSEQFEYLSEKEIRGALKRLNELNLTIEGCYNQMKMDKTKWYSLSDKAIELFGGEPIRQKGKSLIQKGKGFAQKGETIPDRNTDSKHIYNTPISPKGDEASFEEDRFSIKDWEQAYFRICEKYGVERRPYDLPKDKLKRYYDKFVREGRDVQEPLKMLIEVLKNDWQRKNKFRDSALSSLFNPEKIASWTRNVGKAPY